MALKLTTKEGFELEVEGEFTKLLTVTHNEKKILNMIMNDTEVDQLVFMLKGY